MNTPDENPLLSNQAKISAMLREEYATMYAKHPDAIRPHQLAARVIERLDADHIAPFYVRAIAHASLAEMATVMCAKAHRAKEARHSKTNAGIHDGELQQRYPVKRNDEPQYVKRESLTLRELRACADRLRQEGNSKTMHAYALDAETDDKIARGYFDDNGVPHPEMVR